MRSAGETEAILLTRLGHTGSCEIWVLGKKNNNNNRNINKIGPDSHFANNYKEFLVMNITVGITQDWTVAV